MADKFNFREKLSGILEMAESQGKRITLEEVEKYFEEDGLSKEQIDLVCEYLMSQKMAVTGYVKNGGTIKEKEEEPAALSREEQTYIEEYLRDIDQLRGDSIENARMAYYLPKVIDEAIKLHHPEVFIGDMVQEGNISLMVALNDLPDSKEGREDENRILEEVRAGMLALIESQTETRRQDKKMVARVSELDETIKSMSEEFGRKVAVDEVAERLGITEKEIDNILKLAGEEVEN